MEKMPNRSLKLFSILALTLVCATYAMGNRNSATAPGNQAFAKLVVTTNGPTDEWASYGWLWDDGERRNGLPWVVGSGTLGGDSPARSGKGSNKAIFWWITETAWTMKSGPTEIEILNAIGNQGWRLIEIQNGARHSYIPSDINWDTATTYVFQRG